MSSKIAELVFGDCRTVNEHLETSEFTDPELRAVLVNAFRRIDRLQKQVAKLEYDRSGPQHTHGATEVFIG